MLSFCYGTVGSGKTYDAICRIIKDMADGHTVVTINMNLRLELIKKVLLERKLSPYDADQAVGRHERLFTEARFRTLRGTPDRRVKLHADEAHFWWPQNGHYKINLEDVLSVAMSRKKQLDLHVISQLQGQINREVAGLSSDNWRARPLKREPFYSGLKIYSRLARSMGSRGIPCAFWYIRVEDELGQTKSSRKDGTIDPDNKYIRWLDPLVAACYDTLEEVSSPVLDSMKLEARHEYLIDILKGRRKPQSICPVCGGVRVLRQSRIFNYETGCVELAAYSEELRKHPGWLGHTEAECEACAGVGYFFPDYPEHPDFLEADLLKDKLDASFKRGNKRAS
jgi:hypothetical protein